MFFANYRDRKHEEKIKQEVMTGIYPPGYSKEPTREPNPDYKLQTTTEQLCQSLMAYDGLSQPDAEARAIHMLQILPASLKENLDEVVQRKPMSNINLTHGHTLANCMDYLRQSNSLYSTLFAIYYWSAELSGILPTPEEWIAEYKKALIEG